MKYTITILWLAAIVAANLSIGHFGPSASVINAFLLIGLTFTTRDILHEQWEGKNLKVKMGALIATGGILSWLTQPAVGGIAIASVTAFAVSEIADSIIYSKTRSINKSNAVSAGIDSIIFPVMAFGGFPVAIILMQWVAKVAGGFVWSQVLSKKKWVALLAAAGVCGVASGQSLQVHHNEHGEYATVDIFIADGDNEVYAFIDQYNYGANVTYGESCFYRNYGDFAATVQIEGGDSDIFEIEEVVLGGIRWKGIELLARSDNTIQLTYVWFIRRGAWQFNGYIDAWDMENFKLNAQPQLWYNLNDHLAIGGEVFVRHNEFDTTYTPSVGLKINF